MLKKLIVKNFQSHKRLVVELDPLLTVIVGPSDVGKSAIFRALRWLLTNRPRGEAFLRHGSEYVSVALHLDEHVIKRQRMGGCNAYYLDGQEYQQGVGQMGVPEAVSDLLNIDEVSYQGQLDAPFLFSLSPGDVAKELNRVVALDTIDAVLANLSSAVKQTSNMVAFSQGRLQQAEENQAALGWVEQAEKDLKHLEAQEEELNKQQEEVNHLASLLNEIELAVNALASSNQTIIQLGQLVAAGEVIGQQQDELAGLVLLLEQIEECRQEVKEADQELAQQRAYLQEQTQDGCPLCGQIGGDVLA